LRKEAAEKREMWVKRGHAPPTASAAAHEHVKKSIPTGVRGAGSGASGPKPGGAAAKTPSLLKAAPAAASAAGLQAIREELALIYSKAAPEKSESDIDAILCKFSGREQELLEKVKSKYSQ
jgi:hypothetical protein